MIIIVMICLSYVQALSIFAIPLLRLSECLARAADVVAPVPLVPDHFVQDGRYTGSIKDGGFEDCKALQQTNEAPVHGILGADFLKRTRSVIDYGRNCLYII